MNNKDENSIEFWKEKYEELNIQYDEFQKNSYELENELEIQLKQSEDKIKELQHRNSRLAFENDTLKNKLNEVNQSTHKQISQLQGEFAKLKAVKEEMQKYIRELEQKNDDLERTNRCAMFSLGEFESKLNEALERNAILESELDEKDELAETVQRLRDEARDLKQELAVRQKPGLQKDQSQLDISIQPNKLNSDDIKNSFISPPSAVVPVLSDNSSDCLSKEESIIQQSKKINTTIQCLNQTTKIISSTSKPANPNQVTPSLRISSLNYVGDALRKITSMESRLQAAKNLKECRDWRTTSISSVETCR